jgi:hypothetical protein
MEEENAKQKKNKWRLNDYRMHVGEEVDREV